MSTKHLGFIIFLLGAFMISVTNSVLIVCYSKRNLYNQCVVTDGMDDILNSKLNRTTAEFEAMNCKKGRNFGKAVDSEGNMFVWVLLGCGGTFEVTTEAQPTWETWGSWGECSVTCGAGKQTRMRSCSTSDDMDCSKEDNADQEERSCNKAACATQSSGESSICGKTPTNYRYRIIGGTKADNCQYPWMIMLYNKRRHRFCGGSIIDENHVMTAAHCVTTHSVFSTRSYSDRASDIVVFSGAALMPFRKSMYRIPGLTTSSVSKVMRHEDYSTSTLKNDIAILTLTSPIKFDDCHVPLCLATTQVAPNTAGCKVMGWGTTSNGRYSRVSETLLYTNLDIVASSRCERTYGTYFDESSQVCAGGNGHGSCQGDSGGPLICPGSDNRYYQQGIVSGGAKDQCGSLHSFYTSVSSYHSWIKSKLNSNSVQG